MQACPVPKPKGGPGTCWLNSFSARSVCSLKHGTYHNLFCKRALSTWRSRSGVGFVWLALELVSPCGFLCPLPRNIPRPCLQHCVTQVTQGRVETARVAQDSLVVFRFPRPGPRPRGTLLYSMTNSCFSGRKQLSSARLAKLWDSGRTLYRYRRPQW